MDERTQKNGSKYKKRKCSSNEIVNECNNNVTQANKSQESKSTNNLAKISKNITKSDSLDCLSVNFPSLSPKIQRRSSKLRRKVRRLSLETKKSLDSNKKNFENFNDKEQNYKNKQIEPLEISHSDSKLLFRDSKLESVSDFNNLSNLIENVSPPSFSDGSYKFKSPDNSDQNSSFKKKLFQNVITPQSLNNTKSMALSLGANRSDQETSWSSDFHTPVSSQKFEDSASINSVDRCLNDSKSLLTPIENIDIDKKDLESRVVVDESEKSHYNLKAEVDSNRVRCLSKNNLTTQTDDSLGVESPNISSPKFSHKLSPNLRKSVIDKEKKALFTTSTPVEKNLYQLQIVDRDNIDFTPIQKEESYILNNNITPIIRRPRNSRRDVKKVDLNFRDKLFDISEKSQESETGLGQSDVKTFLDNKNIQNHHKERSESDISPGTNPSYITQLPNTNSNFYSKIAGDSSKNFASKFYSRRKPFKIIYPDPEKETEFIKRLGKEKLNLVQDLNQPSSVKKISSFFPEANLSPTSKIDENNLTETKSESLINSGDIVLAHKSSLPENQKQFKAACHLAHINNNNTNDAANLNDSDSLFLQSFLVDQDLSKSINLENSVISSDKKETDIKNFETSSALDSKIETLKKNSNTNCNEENTNFSEKLKNAETYLGFHSASGKLRQVSEKSLEEAKKIWNSSELEAKHVLQQQNVCSSLAKVSGFQTASEKKILVSDEALCKVKMTLNDNSSEEVKIKDSENCDKNKDGKSSKIHSEPSRLCPKPRGFQSASGKFCSVSKKALQYAQELWKNEDEAQNRTGRVDEKKISGFKIVSNKVCNISNCSPSKTGSLCDSVKVTDFSDEIGSTDCFLSSKNSGFHSTSGKYCKVSEEALTKVKKLWNDDEFSDLSDVMLQNETENGGKAKTYSTKFQTNDKSCERTAKSPPVVKGFQTASGNKCTVSKKSIDTAKKLWDDITDASSKEISSKSSLNNSSLKNININVINSVSPVICSQKKKSFSSRKRSIDKIESSQKRSSVNLTSKFIKTDQPDTQNASISKVSGKNLSTNSSFTNKSIPHKIKSTINKESNSSHNVEKSFGKSYMSVRDELNTQEALDLNEITEAFLLDASWNNESDARLNKSKNEYFADPIEQARIFLRKREKELMDSNVKNHIPTEPDGNLYIFKKKNKYNLHRLKNLESLSKSLTPSIEKKGVEITFKNSSIFRFDVNRYMSLLEFYDNVEVIPGPDHCIGFQEVENALFSSRSFNRSSLPDNWVKIHFEQIVWKLASLQTKFQHIFTEKIFTVDNVLKQLRYRYDTEVICGKRSVLRKICEQDDVPFKTMVLFVVKLPDLNFPLCQSIWLSDGWYTLEFEIDAALQTLIKKNKIKVGEKLLIHGTELVGRPSPCHPLEPESKLVRLKLHTNMIRRYYWHAKLGLHYRPNLPPSTLISSLLEGGGMIASLNVVIGRRFPLVFMEKNEDGKCIMLNKKCGELKIRNIEKSQENLTLKAYSEIETEMTSEGESDKKLKINEKDIKFISDPKIISKLIKEANDPAFIQLFSENQLNLASKWNEAEQNRKRREIESRLREKIQNQPLNIVPMLKLKILDKRAGEANLTIWNPQNNLSDLKEGVTVSLHYVTFSNNRNGVPNLSWTKQTFYKLSQDNIRLNSKCEQLFSIQDLYSFVTREDRLLGKNEQTSRTENVSFNISRNPQYKSIDTVGVVVKIASENGREIAYLADSNFRFAKLLFNPTIKHENWHSVVEVGETVIICDATLKFHEKCVMPILYTNVHTHICTSTYRDSVQKCARLLTQQIKKLENFMSTCEKELSKALTLKKLEADEQAMRNLIQAENRDNSSFKENQKESSNFDESKCDENQKKTKTFSENSKKDSKTFQSESRKNEIKGESLKNEIQNKNSSFNSKNISRSLNVKMENKNILTDLDVSDLSSLHLNKSAKVSKPFQPPIKKFKM